jgi:hypothetical protein
LSEIGGVLGGHDRASLEVYLEAMIEQVCIYTWRPRLSDLRDALVRRNRANLEMHLEDIIEQV